MLVRIDNFTYDDSTELELVGRVVCVLSRKEGVERRERERGGRDGGRLARVHRQLHQ